MEKENMIIILLVVVIMIAAFQTFQLVSLGNAPATGGATVATSNGAPDMTGWTDNERMNYEMHGTIPARAGGGSSGSSGMVGGC